MIEFADPFKRCRRCGEWVDAYDPACGEVLPCGHARGYLDVCPSWGPVDGCGCEQMGLPPHPRRDPNMKRVWDGYWRQVGAFDPTHRLVQIGWWLEPQAQFLSIMAPLEIKGSASPVYVETD